MSKPYRPSNASEGHAFEENWCGNCHHYSDPTDDEHCPILLHAQAFGVEDAEYPQEWTYDEHGRPCCTGFVQDGDEAPVQRCARTEDMFGETQP